MMNTTQYTSLGSLKRETTTIYNAISKIPIYEGIEIVLIDMADYKHVIDQGPKLAWLEKLAYWFALHFTRDIVGYIAITHDGTVITKMKRHKKKADKLILFGYDYTAKEMKEMIERSMEIREIQ